MRTVRLLSSLLLVEYLHLLIFPTTSLCGEALTLQGHILTSRGKSKPRISCRNKKKNFSSAILKKQNKKKRGGGEVECSTSKTRECARVCSLNIVSVYFSVPIFVNIKKIFGQNYENIMTKLLYL